MKRSNLASTIDLIDLIDSNRIEENNKSSIYGNVVLASYCTEVTGVAFDVNLMLVLSNLSSISSDLSSASSVDVIIWNTSTTAFIMR